MTDNLKTPTGGGDNPGDGGNPPDDKTKKPTDSQSGDSGDNPNNQEKQDKGKTFTQAELDEIIKKRLREEAERQKRAAEEKAAEEKGEYQKLAGQYKAESEEKTRELEAANQRIESLNAAVSQIIKTEIAGLPDALKEMKPDSDDSLIVLEWLIKAKKAAGKIAGGSKIPGSNDPAPKKGDKVDPEKAAIDYQSRFNPSGF